MTAVDPTLPTPVAAGLSATQEKAVIEQNIADLEARKKVLEADARKGDVAAVVTDVKGDVGVIEKYADGIGQWVVRVAQGGFATLAATGVLSGSKDTNLTALGGVALSWAATELGFAHVKATKVKSGK